MDEVWWVCQWVVIPLHRSFVGWLVLCVRWEAHQSFVVGMNWNWIWTRVGCSGTEFFE